MIQRPTVRDRGTPIYVQFLDERGNPLNTSLATALTCRIAAPLGSAGPTSITLAPSTHPTLTPALGYGEFTPDDSVAENPGWLETGGAGQWQLWPSYRLSAGQVWEQAEPLVMNVWP